MSSSGGWLTLLPELFCRCTAAQALQLAADDHLGGPAADTGLHRLKGSTVLQEIGIAEMPLANKTFFENPGQHETHKVHFLHPEAAGQLVQYAKVGAP